jgi:hypothetical protein
VGSNHFEWLAKINFGPEAIMPLFNAQTVTAMRAVLEEVCSHIPANSTSARTFIASKILECASNGEETYDGLLAAGRRAVIDQFGAVGVVRSTR